MKKKKKRNSWTNLNEFPDKSFKKSFENLLRNSVKAKYTGTIQTNSQ